MDISSHCPWPPQSWHNGHMNRKAMGVRMEAWAWLHEFPLTKADLNIALPKVQTCQRIETNAEPPIGTPSPDQRGANLITLDFFHLGICSNLSKMTKINTYSSMSSPCSPAGPQPVLLSKCSQNVWPTDFGCHLTLLESKGPISKQRKLSSRHLIMGSLNIKMLKLSTAHWTNTNGDIK